MSGRKLFCLTQKLEYMCVRLGGQPDREVKVNQQVIDDFEHESKKIQKMLIDCKSFILKR